MQQIHDIGIVPVIAIDDASKAVPLAKALVRGGLPAAWLDYNAGAVADGEKTLDRAGDELLELVLETASGKQTRQEEAGYREISIFKDGVIL